MFSKGSCVTYDTIHVCICTAVLTAVHHGRLRASARSTLPLSPTLFHTDENWNSVLGTHAVHNSSLDICTAVYDTCVSASFITSVIYGTRNTKSQTSHRLGLRGGLLPLLLYVYTCHEYTDTAAAVYRYLDLHRCTAEVYRYISYHTKQVLAHVPRK